MASRSPSRSPSRGRDHSRSPSKTPSRSPTPRRSISPRSPARNGTRGRDSKSRSKSANRSISRDRSRGRGPNRQSPPPSAKIVVEKLTKNVNDAHLREIFGIYGPVKSVDMPMNRQCALHPSVNFKTAQSLTHNPVMTNRGTAYILYEDTLDAEAAISHMHEAQLDGALINVSIVLPKRRFSKSPPLSRRVESFKEMEQERARAAPPPAREYRGPPGPAPRYRSPPRRRDSPPSGPPRSYRGASPRERGSNMDTYRPRSYSRSRSPPPRRRERSPSYSSRSRSPPRRGAGGGYRRRDSPPRGGAGGGGRRRRSPSYSSYGSRSRSPSRGPRRR